MNLPLRLPACAAIALLVTSHALRATTVTVLDAKLNRVEVDLQQLDAAGLRGSTPQGPVQVALQDLLAIDRPAASPSPPGAVRRFQLVLRNGERLTGNAVGLANDSVQWMTNILGQREVPLAQIEQIALAGDDDSVTLSADEQTRDVLLLANGDRAGGIIVAMDNKSVTVQGADGATVPIEWANVRRVHLAKSGDAPSASGNWRVSLADGSVCDVDSVTVSQQMCVVQRGSAKNKLGIDSIVSIENLAGRARLLLRLPVLSREYAPYFPRIGHEDTIDVPERVTIGDAKTGAFIAVRPYSRITWAIPENQATFKTHFAVAPTGALANCRVRIWLDGKNVLDKGGLTSQTPAEVFETPVGAARTLTLEVDFGENFDVQDQLYWIEPAFIAK